MTQITQLPTAGIAADVSEAKDKIVESARRNAAGFKSMAYEAAALWFQDFAGDSYSTIVDLLEAAVEKVELHADRLTAGLKKPDAAFLLVWPTVVSLLEPHFTGLGGRVAKNILLPRIELAIRATINTLVAYRNQVLGKSWGQAVRNWANHFAYPLEEWFQVDLTGDGIFGPPPEPPKEIAP